MSNEAKTIKVLEARVVSNKMDKTVAVEIVRKVKHKLYNKYIKRLTKLLVHDESNSCNEGDLVEITQCRPISKGKSWKLVRVIESSNNI